MPQMWSKCENLEILALQKRDKDAERFLLMQLL
jgi:hypothetical protein